MPRWLCFSRRSFGRRSFAGGVDRIVCERGRCVGTGVMNVLRRLRLLVLGMVVMRGLVMSRVMRLLAGRRLMLGIRAGLGFFARCRFASCLVAIAAGRAVAMAIAAMPPATLLVFFFRVAMRAAFFLDQGLTVGDRDLIIVRMDFGEGEKAVPVAAVIDEGRLK